MDATHSMLCRHDDLINPLSSMCMQVSCILVISHFFNVVLKTFGQPGPISQILAGVVLGPTALSHVKQIQEIFFLQSSMNYYEVVSFFCRIFITFLFGLEMNIEYIWLNRRLVSLVAGGGAGVAAISALGVSFYLFKQLTSNASLPYFCIIIMLIVSYTSSPLVIRLASEMRLVSSNIGRIAVSSAIVTEMACLMCFNLLLSWHSKNFLRGFGCFIITGAVILITRYLALWLNKRHVNQKYLKAPQLLLILFLLVGKSMIIEIWGYNSIISCFLVGLMFPREGKAARTLLHKLGYSIYNFVLPVYFGYLGFQCNLIGLKNLHDVINVAILIFMGICAKLSGTLLACRYLEIPLSEGIFLGFMLNTRGYADLLFFGAASKEIITFSMEAYNVLVVATVLNTIISGIIVASLARVNDKMFANQHTTLESQQVEDELRILACMYDPRQLSSILAIVLAINGPRTSPATIYSMHLIELVKKIKSNMLYHQKENAELSDDDDYGGNDVVEINEAIDNFTTQTKILVHQRKAVSAFPSLYEDVCNDADDLHATIILLPFHKHQRIDGKLESGKEGIRTTNQKILRHAPCSVGIIVERGMSGTPGFSQLTASDGIQNVATLFFGGADDREAIAWSIRMAQHPKINLTIIRFLPASMPKNETSTEESEDKEILMMSGHETAKDLDNTFMLDFYNRFVVSGQIGYVEKFASNGAQTVEVLKEIGDMYSLFVVGKGGRGHCSLTIGMSDWEECPELGSVGDVLASSELVIDGSVLIVQQHRDVKENLMND